ncbi:GHKL domain-containing protein [Streptococcus loxodontisalivarius]|uniref:Two-component system sensor histidine kinase AgrC n=1 Tax=Streptococcus loxodontisalivarius TaxID=1349415 RepID=A0ABS2PRD9_9STRE|nr:GHKL domain-containing protein [Streptococcus loxodontisalivarius]MBM7642602.1 two-component system sensor histidine kinase AgrC [Streptococcus loxodontisalivarius]
MTSTHYLLLFLYGAFIEFSIVSITYYVYTTISNKKWSIKLNILLYLALFISYVIFRQGAILLNLLAFFILSYWQNKEKEWRYRLYYAFFPVLYVDLWSRFYSVIVFTYIFSKSIEEVNYSTELYFASYLLVFPTYFISRSILMRENSQADLYNPKDAREAGYVKTILYGLLAYFLVIYAIPAIHGEIYYFKFMSQVPLLTSYRKTSIFIFGMLTVLLLSYRNQFLKIRLKERLKRQYDDRLANLANYGKQLEVLYKNIAYFKLESGVELKEFEEVLNKNDLELANQYFQDVMSETHHFDKNYYSLTKLANLKITSLKSFLASKIISGEEEGIEINLELPDLLTETPLTELELVRIVSIFWDNAVEATRLSQKPQINFAFFHVDDQLMLIIENTTSDEKIDIGELFEEGFSTKGKDRGIGLWTVQKILNDHSNISLTTESKKYRFSQRLIMNLEE